MDVALRDVERVRAALVEADENACLRAAVLFDNVDRVHG